MVDAFTSPLVLNLPAVLPSAYSLQALEEFASSTPSQTGSPCLPKIYDKDLRVDKKSGTPRKDFCYDLMERELIIGYF